MTCDKTMRMKYNEYESLGRTLMSGDMRLAKWTRLYQNPNHKPMTEKQLKKYKEKEKKLIESLSDFYEDDLWLYKSSLDNK